MQIAQGSLAELDTHQELPFHLNYISREIWTALDGKLTDEDKMLSGLIASLKAKE